LRRPCFHLIALFCAQSVSFIGSFFCCGYCDKGKLVVICFFLLNDGVDVAPIVQELDLGDEVSNLLLVGFNLLVVLQNALAAVQNRLRVCNDCSAVA